MEQWQEKVVESLAGLNKWAESIDKRLDTLNGTVGRHDKAITVLREAEAVRAGIREAREREAAKRRHWVDPLIRYGIVIGSVLLLDHGPQIVSELTRVVEAIKP